MSGKNQETKGEIEPQLLYVKHQKKITCKK